MADLKYADCKMVVSYRNKDGKFISELTSWREDFIKEVLSGAQIDGFEVGETVHITIMKNDIEPIFDV
jgi:hypothetical protein